MSSAGSQVAAGAALVSSVLCASVAVFVGGCAPHEQVSPRQRMLVEASMIGQIGLPVYPGTVTVEGYVTNGKNGQNIRALFLSTTDPIAKVAAFYKSRVPKNSKVSLLLEGDSGTANFTFEQGHIEKQITLSTGSNATQIELLSIEKPGNDRRVRRQGVTPHPP